MKLSPSVIKTYLEYCEIQKNLSDDTLKAYRIDLTQAFNFFCQSATSELTKENISLYLGHLHKSFSPSSVRRKVASLKALCSYLEFEGFIIDNPFARLKIKYNEPFRLPRTIPIDVIEKLLVTAYDSIHLGSAKSVFRDIAVMELLFAIGARVSEICNLATSAVDLNTGCVWIFGKGSKERLLEIGNMEVITALSRYYYAYQKEIANCGYFFVNRYGKRLSPQSVRNLISNYAYKANIPLHITPHMFRHTFATELLEADVDIRCIQDLLGHSSISTTQIYTRVTAGKKRDILLSKHPRNQMIMPARTR